MPTIHLTTFIAAPIDVVYDLSRHIGLHKESMEKYKEEAVAGTRFGLLENEDTVTWKARHLYKTRLLRVKLTNMKKPDMFIDEQLQGDFKVMRHEHHFKTCENGTILINVCYFETPYGKLGEWVNHFFLTRYMKNLIEQHNNMVREFAESNKWKKLLII